jgi:hypothetical protein
VFLDDLRPAQLPLWSPFAALDRYTGVLGIMCSHLYVHNNLYLRAVMEGSRIGAQKKLTPDAVRAVCQRLGYLSAQIDRGQETKAPSVEMLSARVLVDGLAIYLNLRSGNPEITAAQIRQGLESQSPRLWHAFRVAEYWLGSRAWELFPLAGTFALSCQKPIQAYLEALKQMGKRDADRLLKLDSRSAEHLLAVWTGHDAVDIHEVVKQVPRAPLLRSRLDV